MVWSEPYVQLVSDKGFMDLQ